MKTTYHPADSRGYADHGWLKSYHSFSFANYHNPERMQFGVLRVLNDDLVAAGQGFGRHPHDNMEIISIALRGDLRHEDSMGNRTVIKQGDVQVMSAGKGIFHSEMNHNSDKEVAFLQIWLFPNKRNVEPRYDQISLMEENLDNKLAQILSPSPDDEGVWVHQDAWFYMGNLKPGFTENYKVKKAENGLYFFVINGEVTVGTQQLGPRDGYAIEEVETIDIKAGKDATLLLMDIPMNRF